MCIDVSKMDEVVSVNHADMDVTVQPGVTRGHLNTYLRDSGLWFPIGKLPSNQQQSFYGGFSSI